tara:strand:- start:89 stop:406 length:318 start_codon:yes stop_codon:yes gene_type:complete
MEHQDWNTITFNNSYSKNKKHNNYTSQKQYICHTELKAPPNLGKLISQARGDKTRQEIANTLGIAVTLFTRWETGKDIPSNNDIAKLERLLKIKLPRNKKVKLLD